MKLNSTRNLFSYQVWDQFRDQIKDQAGIQVRVQVWDQFRDQVEDQIWVQVIRKIEHETE